MNKFKKFVGLLSIVSLIVVSGCGTASNNASPEESSATTTDQPLPKISIFQTKVEIAESLEALAKVYTAETGNEVEVWGSAGDNYSTQLQIHLGANSGPTIFTVSFGSDADKLQSYFSDLSDVPTTKDIAPNMALERDGKIVGIPLGVEGFGIVYNKDIVDPGDVTDLASFTNTLEQLKADGLQPFSLSQENSFLITHILNTPFALQPDPQDFIEKLNDGEVKITDTKEFQEFAKFMDVIKAYGKNPMEVTYDTQMGDFATGKTAMIHQGNWSYTMLDDYDNMDDKLGMMPLPIEGNSKLSVGVSQFWVVNADASADEIEAGKQFLNWLYTSDAGKTAIVQDFKLIPAFTTIQADLNPLSNAVYEAAESGQTIPWAFRYFPQNVDLIPVTQQYFLDQNMTGQELLEKFDEEWAKATRSVS
ncbi:sugar ABC transporter substrate-binding protein [Paenibacillus campinasensis]|uniref:ABC transporter substrate-binding protein n=1 Tax=Paenibacillus campinasensis TaxID=66347 RepID=A0A268EPU3_9BACL|nr:ABC transporter substrate-binding protein [Paenibacillus campinasensis]PAD75153.1 ABC transporter substrate-binding protein [Paenibacillus campinasensis]